MHLRAGLGQRALVVVPIAAGLLACGAADREAAGQAGLASAAATPMADLRPAAPSFSRSGQAALRFFTTVRNRGRARARSSVLAVVLSRDRSRGGGDAHLGRLAVRALAPGSTATVRGTLDLPPAASSGRYWVIACADARHRVGESSETNNCRRSRTQLQGPSTPGGSTPPRFNGIVSATTCLPGPPGPSISSRYQLRWEPATDDQTAREAIVYDVYRASRPGRQDFAGPTYTTAPGAASFTTPPLPSDQTWYFVVRARNGAGSRDANAIELLGENICE